MKASSLVLWIALQSWRSPKKPRIKPIILTTQTHIPNNKNFRFVSTYSLSYIGNYLQNRPVEYSDKEVSRLVDRLKKFVTT